MQQSVDKGSCDVFCGGVDHPDIVAAIVVGDGTEVKRGLSGEPSGRCQGIRLQSKAPCS